MEAYKKLEQQCNLLFNDKHGISIYIDKMTKVNNPNIANWNNDLKKLKHYRYIRNKIVHEPNCSIDKMTNLEDVKWLNNFSKRIINKSDPLTLYNKKRPLKAIAIVIAITIIGLIAYRLLVM